MMMPLLSTMALLNKKRSVRTALAAVLGVALLAGSMTTGVRAAEEEEEDVAFDTKIIRDILRTLGLRKGDDGIEYRERSPLVVPPSRNLTPPVTAKFTEKSPAWPNDQDVKRRKEAKAKQKDARRNVDWDAVTRPMSPTALRGNGTGEGSPTQPNVNNNSIDVSSPMRPSELGSKGGLFSGLFGGPKEEYMTFTGEQPRTSLIEPPSGYRTPSPYQPYGVGKEKWTPPVIDRHEPIR